MSSGWSPRMWLQLPILLAGTALVAVGSFRVSLVEPFTGGALALLSILLVSLCSLWAGTALRPTLRVTVFLIVLSVSTATGFVIGNRWADETIREEIPHLLREVNVRRYPKVPDLFDVNGSKYFRRASLFSGPNGVGVRVRFGLPDGTVVEHVSNVDAWHRERTRACTKEIQPGWYRRSRCAN
jgi:hypothetical protein